MPKQANISLEHPQEASLFITSITLALICILPFIFTKLFYRPEPLQTVLVAPPTEIILSKPIVQRPTPATNTQAVIPKKVVSTPQKPPAPVASASSARIITAQPGDTLGRIFKRLGLPAKNLHAVIQHQPQARILAHLRPQQTLELTIKDHLVEKLVFPYNLTESLVVKATPHGYQGSIEKQPTTLHHEYLCATVRGSLYNTAKRHNVPLQLIRQMTNIFNRDVDFKRGIRSGDHFTILYTTHYINQKLVKTGEILAVTYTNKGKTHEAVRYTNKDGSTNYYTPQGLSLNRSYDRYPVRFSHIASPFSLSRYHPLLHYRRPHYGIDLAAPLGTPIRAIGDGRIEVLGRQGGYGNMVRIRHNGIYSTIYGHLSRFEKGLSRGSAVKRGQVIGYVGQSGLASGPHCHFEFHIHHQPKNPTTIQLPHGNPIPHREMASFKSRVQGLLKELRARASRSMRHETQYASNDISNKQKA